MSAAEWRGLQWSGAAATALSCTRKSNGAATIENKDDGDGEDEAKLNVAVHYRPLNNSHFHCTQGTRQRHKAEAQGTGHGKADYEKLSLFAYVNRIS